MSSEINDQGFKALEHCRYGESKSQAGLLERGGVAMITLLLSVTCAVREALVPTQALRIIQHLSSRLASQRPLTSHAYASLTTYFPPTFVSNLKNTAALFAPCPCIFNAFPPAAPMTVCPSTTYALPPLSLTIVACVKFP